MERSETKPVVVYSCNSIPPEWIAAHGFHPVRLTASVTHGDDSKYSTMGLCPYIKSLLHSIQSTTNMRAFILTTICDQMRRSYELMEQESSLPVFLFNVPKVRTNSLSHQMYKEELLRLGEFLVRCGGTSPNIALLEDTILRYELQRCDQQREDQINNPRNRNEFRLAIIGGPLMEEHQTLLDQIKQMGGCIVLNAAENGLMGLPQPMNRVRLKTQPLDELMHMYWELMPAVYHRPNTFMYDCLQREIEARGVQGILFLHYTWCDLWKAELNRIKETFQLPMVVLEENGSFDNGSRHRQFTRIQMLLEMIEP